MLNEVERYLVVVEHGPLVSRSCQPFAPDGQTDSDERTVMVIKSVSDFASDTLRKMALQTAMVLR